jgi:ribosomal protein S18 acetylase RimI-like enzyme
VVVRPPTLEDRPQLIELIKGYFDFYHTSFPGEARLHSLLDELARDAGLGTQLVAGDNGALIGFATLYACFDTLAADRILIMNDLYVAADFRNQGVGSALLHACLAYATAHGYARLDWVTAEDNRGAQRFYDRHGGRRGPWVSYSIQPAPAQSRR